MWRASVKVGRRSKAPRPFFPVSLFLFRPARGALNGVDHIEERESVEMGIVCGDRPDSVFFHEHGRVRIVNEIAGYVSYVIQYFRHHGCVAVGFDEHSETG
jgi:hypothetical protein